MKTITAPQARLIAYALEALDTLPSYADGQYLRVDLMDELLEDPIGTFTNEEGTWLFEVREEPAPKPATEEEIAQSVFDSNPEYYRERKIAFIKDLRGKWYEITDRTLSLVEGKKTVEKILQDDATARLRAKLVGDSDPRLTKLMNEPEWWDDEDRAYAEHRERTAEQGTWFGPLSPLDEEPF